VAPLNESATAASATVQQLLNTIHHTPVQTFVASAAAATSAMRRQHEVERMQRENEQLQQRLRQAEAKLQQYMHQQQTHKSSISSSSSSSSHPTLPAGRRLFGRDEEEEEEKRDEEEDEDVQKEIEEPPSSDGEDDPYKSYNAWLDKRQEMYPFEKEHNKKYYRHRHTLLNHNGRVMEYWRFGLLTGFPVRLYASPWQRYEDQIQREVGYKTERRLWRSVSMDQLNRSVPEFLPDRRDNKTSDSRTMASMMCRAPARSCSKTYLWSSSKSLHPFQERHHRR
jgi:type II secretory pathway pseudopilin PulG